MGQVQTGKSKLITRKKPGKNIVHILLQTLSPVGQDWWFLFQLFFFITSLLQILFIFVCNLFLYIENCMYFHCTKYGFCYYIGRHIYSTFDPIYFIALLPTFLLLPSSGDRISRQTVLNSMLMIFLFFKLLSACGCDIGIFNSCTF